MAPPCLVLPSNITDTSLVEPPCPGKDNSFFILSTSCLKIRVIYYSCWLGDAHFTLAEKAACRFYWWKSLPSEIPSLLLVCMLVQLKVASVASCRLFSRLSASLMKQSPWQSDADLWSGKYDRVTELSSCHIFLSYCTFPLLTVRNGLWQLWLVLARHFSERAKSFGSNRLA